MASDQAFIGELLAANHKLRVRVAELEEKNQRQYEWLSMVAPQVMVTEPGAGKGYFLLLERDALADVEAAVENLKEILGKYGLNQE